MQDHRYRTGTRILTLGLALLAMLAGGLAPASAHDGPRKAARQLLDPAKRSEITGTVLITGANRGIGLELARNYAQRGWRVIATARKPAKATELNALATAHPGLSVERLDVLDQAQVDALAKKYRGQPIDVLLNNAAILGNKQAQLFGSYDFAEFNRVMNTNVAGALRVSQAFYANVVASKQKKIVAMTSVQGSLTLVRNAMIQFYNASKAALNMSMRAVSKAVKDDGVTVVLISPGAVDTDMMAKALAGLDIKLQLLAPAESAEAVINIVDQYGLDMSGTFISHQGTRLPW